MIRQGMLSANAFGLTWGIRLEQAIRGLLFVYIASLPFPKLLFIERHAFIVLMGLMVIWSVVNRRLWFVPTPIDAPLLTWVIWIGITIPFASFPDYSLKEFGKLLQGVIVFYAVVFFLGHERQRNALVNLLVLIVIVVSLAGIYQFDPANYQATRSFLTSEVWLTTFLVMLIPLCWALAVFDRQKARSAVFLIAGFLATGCLLLTQSRAGLLALVVEAWIFVLLYRHRLFQIAVYALTGIVLLLFLMATYVDRTASEGPLLQLRKVIPFRTFMPSIEHRFDIWSFALAEIGQHPIVGIGYGGETLRSLYPDNHDTGLVDGRRVMTVGTHNIFLYLALHVGIPGLCLFVWVLGSVIHGLRKAYLHATEFPAVAIFLGVMTGVCGLLVRIQFDQMFVGTMALLFWVLLALAVAHMEGQRKNRGTAQAVCVS